MTIVFASDHAGFSLRELLDAHARTLGHETMCVGAESEDAYDYPDAADLGSAIILSGRARFGVFVCGSGVGICIQANRHKGIRGAACVTVEQARLSRLHNHANVLCLGQRLTEPNLACEIMDAFLVETEDHAERHERRVAKMG